MRILRFKFFKSYFKIVIAPANSRCHMNFRAIPGRQRSFQLLICCSLVILSLLSACDSNKDRSDDTPAGESATTRAVEKSADASVEQVIGKPAKRVVPLSEYGGRIRHVIFHAPEDLVGQMWRPIYDLLNAMPKDVRITFACSSMPAAKEIEGRLRQWKFNTRQGIDWFCIDRPLLVWARDRYIALRPESKDSPRWLMPALVPNRDLNRRSYERRVARILAGRQYENTIVHTDVILEGGNVLASEKRVFVGASVLQDNASLGARDKIESVLAELFGLPVVLVGDDKGKTPIAHLDMFVTILDDKNVLVGSPTLAVDILKVADEASKKGLRERLFILPEVGDEKVSTSIVERGPSFDSIAKSLSQAGVHVERIPYADSRGGDFVVTYNNVIQEQRDGRHIVYMPTYEIPALDEAARKTYEKLGCDVKPIDVAPISHLLGAVHCLTNVTERSADAEH